MNGRGVIRAGKVIRVLFVQGKSVGHIQAAIAVAGRLRDLGCDVTFTGPPSLAEKVGQSGFPCVPDPIFQSYPLPIGVGRRPADLARLLRSPRRAWTKVREARAVLKTFEASASRIGARMREIWQEHSPDLVVFDPFLLYYYAPIHNLGAKCISLSSKQPLHPWSSAPPYTSHFVIRETIASKAWCFFLWLKRAIAYWLWCKWEETLFGTSPRRFAAVLSSASGFPLKHQWQSRYVATDVKLRAVEEWLLQAPELGFPGEASNAGTCYIGPLARELGDASGRWREHRAAHVLVVLTTVHRPSSAAALRRDRFMAELLAAACAFPHLEFCISTGPNFHLPPDRSRPKNIRVAEWLPVSELLANCQVVICQAGNNLVRECLLLGKRLIVFPDAADQPGTAARLAFHKLARRGDFRRPSAREIASLIKSTLADPDASERQRWAQSVCRHYADTPDALQLALDQALRETKRPAVH